MFVHERSLRGVRRVRARTPRDASIAHDSSFLSRRERRAARVQINRLIWRRSRPRPRRKFSSPSDEHRSWRCYAAARDRGRFKGAPFPLDASGVVRPGRGVRPGRVDGSRGARRYRYRFFCALVTETETPCPAAIDAALAEANALGTSPSWTAIASGARFGIGDTARFTVTYSVGASSVERVQRPVSRGWRHGPHRHPRHPPTPRGGVHRHASTRRFCWSARPARRTAS